MERSPLSSSSLSFRSKASPKISFSVAAMAAPITSISSGIGLPFHGVVVNDGSPLRRALLHVTPGLKGKALRRIAVVCGGIEQSGDPLVPAPYRGATSSLIRLQFVLPPWAIRIAPSIASRRLTAALSEQRRCPTQT